MFRLRNSEKRSLLSIARRSIGEALAGERKPGVSMPTGDLAVQNGVFVTLRRRGRLRGCIGRVAAVEPLAEVIAECAIGAATSDPRFPALQQNELSEIEIELSVLSHPKRAVAEEVQPGIHGLIISRGAHRGVLLPQVAAEHHWSRERFLEETCQKAGLAPDAWKDSETQIEVFTAQIFSESDCDQSEENDGSANADAYSSSQ